MLVLLIIRTMQAALICAICASTLTFLTSFAWAAAYHSKPDAILAVTGLAASSISTASLIGISHAAAWDRFSITTLRGSIEAIPYLMAASILSFFSLPRKSLLPSRPRKKDIEREEATHRPCPVDAFIGEGAARATDDFRKAA